MPCQEQGTARNDETMARSALLFVQAIKWSKLRRRYSIQELELKDRLREARGVCGPYSNSPEGAAADSWSSATMRRTDSDRRPQELKLKLWILGASFGPPRKMMKLDPKNWGMDTSSKTLYPRPSSAQISGGLTALFRQLDLERIEVERLASLWRFFC